MVAVRGYMRLRGDFHSAGGVEVSLSALRELMPTIPARTHQYYLNLGLKRGDLIREGKARATRYNLINALYPFQQSKQK